MTSSLNNSQDIGNLRNAWGKTENKATASMTDKNRLKTDLEAEVYEMLEKYERTSMKEFGSIFNLSTREVRKLIEGMRRKGIRIGSDHRGYYLCNNEKEFQTFLKSYTAQAKSILSIAQAMKGNNNGQIYFDK